MKTDENDCRVFVQATHGTDAVYIKSADWFLAVESVLSD